MIEIDNNEKIVRVVRKHWFVLLGNILVLLCAVALPMILLFALNLLPFGHLIAPTGDARYLESFVTFAWLLIVWMLAWSIWTDYYLDVLIITDKRVFDITQEGLFKRTSSSFRLDNIQNTTVEMKGVIQTLLDFGTIRLETAGESEDFVATFIAHPYEIKKMINELQDQEVDKSQPVHLNENAVAQ